MAVWGIGAYYKGDPGEDKSNVFINDNTVYIGWNEQEAPPLYRMFESIKNGDIVYIKSYNIKGRSLSIKALGIVKSSKKITNNNGTGITVKWVKKFIPIDISATDEMFKNNVFNNTLYEEYNESIIDQLTDYLI